MAKTQAVGADPAGSGHAARPPRTLRQKIEDANAAIPFRLKLALVWIAIWLVLFAFFRQSDFDTGWMRDHAWIIVKGVWVTILFSVIAIIGAVTLALLGALGRLSKNAIAYGVSGFYTSFFRGTPLIVQLFLWMFALPQLGAAFRPPIDQWFIWTPQVAGCVGLAMNYGAYMTEIFRAGIQSVPHGQIEAAEALGMTYRQRMRRVVLPQAFRVIIPPTGNEFIAMMKDTALIAFLGSTIFWADPFRRALLVGTKDFRNLEALLMAALVYWGLTAFFTLFQRKLEKRVSRGYVRHSDAVAAQSLTRFVPAHGAGGGAGGAEMFEIPEPGGSEGEA